MDGVDSSQLTAKRFAHNHRTPRFGVRHILLWFAGCGVYLAIVRAVAGQQATGLGAALVLAMTISSGAALAGLIVFVTRQFRASHWVIEPGEWLLAILGALVVCELTLQSLRGKIFSEPATLLTAIASCLMVLPLLSRKQATWWKVIFSLMVLFGAIPVIIALLPPQLGGESVFLMRSAGWLGGTKLAAYSLLVVIAAAIDFGYGHRRSWLHWVGIAVLLWNFAVDLFVRIVI